MSALSIVVRALTIAVAAVTASVWQLPLAVRAQQPPAFRAGVDLIAVDVQVVDGNGGPMVALDRDKFEVTIDGRKRRVISADLVQHTTADSGRPANLEPAPAGASGVPASSAGRTFIVAIDAASFGAGEALPVLNAAREFIRKLPAEDRVGLFTLPPFGAQVDPTLDHNAVRLALDRVAGQRPSMNGRFHLSASEIIDISSETSGLGSPSIAGTRGAASAQGVLQRVQLRECRTIDLECESAIVSEVAALAQHLEERVIQSLNGLSSLLQVLRQYEGRKTVVVVSAGMSVSDRTGARVDVGNEAKVLGEQAAHANATIYALHVEMGMTLAFSAEARRARDTAALNREQRLSGRILDEFSGASGGALLPVLVGNGDVALDRVLRETSAFYLLGVEPANMDRDGKAHRLNVKVNQRGATVRSRQWVVLRKEKF